MKKHTLLLLCFIFALSAAFADGPFRAHRFDSFKNLPVDSTHIVFLGNSITDMHDWAEAFNNPHILNRGVSGALSSEILENLDPIVSGHPKAVFLMIGTNDLGSGIAPAQVADNIRQIVKRFRKESPATKLYLQSILPSTVGTRTLENERATNDLIRQIAQEYEAVYIDLWDALFDICMDHNNTLDGLHLKASGCKIWCEIIDKYLGNKCVYPNKTFELQKYGDLWGSNAMRASYFSVLPVHQDDILFFGDEMVKCGEWRELLHGLDIKNRGTGWGYDGTSNSIATVKGLVDAVFCKISDASETPRTLLLYTGTGNVNSNEPLKSVETKYALLVRKMQLCAPNSKLYLVSLMPTENENDRIIQFNNFVQQMCDVSEQLEYIDIYTPLVKERVANPEFFAGNYLMGQGYRLVAQLLGEQLKNVTPLPDKSELVPKNKMRAPNHKEIRLQRNLLKSAYQTKSDSLLLCFFENWSKAYQPDTVPADPYLAEAYKVYYDFFDPVKVDELMGKTSYYDTSQYFVVRPKLPWLGLADSIGIDDYGWGYTVLNNNVRYYKNAEIWDADKVFFAPIAHPKCLYLTDEYQSILDKFLSANHKEEQKSRADFLNRFAYFYKWPYWENYAYETDPVVVSLSLDLDMRRAFIRYSCEHRHYEGYAYMEKVDGKWEIVRLRNDIAVD